MATAPVLFSSNINDDEVEDQRQMIYNMSSNDNVEIEFEKICEVDIKNHNKENDMEINNNNNKENNMKINNNNKENNKTILCETKLSTPKEILADVTSESNKKKRKITETEDELKIKRIKDIIEQDRQLSQAKLRHEETMAAIKENHLKEINKLEVRTSLAKAELAELTLKKEKEHI